MTNKQIRIHDVDVSGCSWYTQGATGMICTDWHISNDCSKNPNCYYKQLKRKEQECEELKKGYSELTDIVSPYMDDFRGYNEELGGFDIVFCVKELMEQLEAYKMEAEEGKEINAELKAENDTYKKMLEDEEVILALNEIRTGERHLWYNKAQRLEQTLAEIKEVLQFYNKTTIGVDKGNGIFEFEVSNDNVLGGKLIYCYDTNPAKEALQKISEVEDD